MTATASTNLSGLVAICHTAFAKRPAEETLGLIATATVELVDANSAWILLVGGDETMLVTATPDGTIRHRWDVRAADADRLMARLAGQRGGVALNALAGPRSEWEAIFGSREDALIGFPFGSSVAGGALVVACDPIAAPSEERARQLEVVAVQIELAIRTAQLAEEHQDQMVSLARMVVGLRQQSHEHVTELQELQRSLNGDSPEEAEELMADYREAQFAGVSRIESPIVAGLLLGEMSVARNRGVTLSLSSRSNLGAVPDSLGDLGFASVISNLLSNAFDAVEGLASSRRRVTIAIRQRDGRTDLDVRDWGVGFGEHSPRNVIRSGYSSKAPERGTGLALVNRLVLAADGDLKIEGCRVGTRVKVTLPDG